MLHEDITEKILNAAIKVLSALGAGMLKSACQACLHYQFTVDGLQFEHQVRLPIIYLGIRLDAGYRIDFLVDNYVVVEVKAVEKLLPLHWRRFFLISSSAIGRLVS